MRGEVFSYEASEEGADPTSSVKRCGNTRMAVDVVDVLGEPIFKFIRFRYRKVKLRHPIEKFNHTFTNL